MPWSWNKCLLPPRHQYPVSFEYCPKSPTSHRVQCSLFCSSVPLVPAPPPPPPPRVWVWAWRAGPAGRRPSPAPAPPPPPWPGGTQPGTGQHVTSVKLDHVIPCLTWDFEEMVSVNIVFITGKLIFHQNIFDFFHYIIQLFLQLLRSA